MLGRLAGVVGVWGLRALDELLPQRPCVLVLRYSTPATRGEMLSAYIVNGYHLIQVKLYSVHGAHVLVRRPKTAHYSLTNVGGEYMSLRGTPTCYWYSSLLRARGRFPFLPFPSLSSLAFPFSSLGCTTRSRIGQTSRLPVIQSCGTVRPLTTPMDGLNGLRRRN